MIGTLCEIHPGERKKKFCKEPNCLERLCSYCVQERHSSHEVIEFSDFLADIKGEKEKSTLNKGKVLSEYKQLLNSLEHLQRQLVDINSKVRVKEKKLRFSIESRLKILSDEIASQQGKAQKVLEIAIEDISAAKNDLAKSIDIITKKAEHIMLKGDTCDIKQFFGMIAKNLLIEQEKLRGLAKESCKEFGILQEIEQKISIDNYFTVPPVKHNESPVQMSVKQSSHTRTKTVVSMNSKARPISAGKVRNSIRVQSLSLIHICRCRRYAVCRSRWSPDH
eukprot:TRINITY_DN12635_c0_g1_i2.p1 TRINITY_DN12635_c0_g1~~TRINITY_DN12635_c0_g1_i2.p1  ORF type:complete len:297 (-),score=24.39 TRINITY_DN12635_c0_g1_i2:15-851(-)